MDLRTRPVIRWVLALAALSSVIACGGGDDEAAGLDATGANVQSEVFDKSCAFSSCHSGASPSGDMSLADPSLANIVGVPSSQQPDLNRIEPGDPDRSYLYLKLTEDTPAVGVRMPTTVPLDDERIELVRAWIAAGAPE